MTEPNLPVVPEHEKPVVDALAEHIKRERKVFQLIAVLLTLMLVAMGVGSYLIYRNATNPSRILAVVDKEFTNLVRQQMAGQAKSKNDVCSFLRDNHLKASAKVQRDFQCPLKPHSTSVGGNSSKPNATPGSSNPGTTVIVKPGNGGGGGKSGGGSKSTSPSSPPKHHKSGGGSKPTPTPTPTCQLVSILGKCLLPGVG